MKLPLFVCTKIISLMHLTNDTTRVDKNNLNDCDIAVVSLPSCCRTRFISASIALNNKSRLLSHDSTILNRSLLSTLPNKRVSELVSKVSE